MIVRMQSYPVLQNDSVFLSYFEKELYTDYSNIHRYLSLNEQLLTYNETKEFSSFQFSFISSHFISEKIVWFDYNMMKKNVLRSDHKSNCDESICFL